MLTPLTAIEPVRNTQSTNMLVRLNVIDSVSKQGFCSFVAVM